MKIILIKTSARTQRPQPPHPAIKPDGSSVTVELSKRLLSMRH